MDFELRDANELRYIWDHQGHLPESDQVVELEDILSTTTGSIFLPQVLDEIIREAVEPVLLGTSLLTEIPFRYGQMTTFPALGALVAADIGEGEEYPEASIQAGGGVTVAKSGKSGIAVKITEEMIRYSQWDIIAMWLRAAGFAMGRHKEKKIFNMIRSFGVKVFDNAQPSKSLYGPTHGRALTGAANGSIIIDDIFDAYGQVLHQGYTPNTLLMHPLSWVMWVKDPTLRAFALASGGGVFYAGWSGNPAARAPWGNGSMGRMGPSGGQSIVPGSTPTGGTVPNSETPSTLLKFPQNLTSAPKLPSYGNLPLAILVSPFVPYDPRSRLTDIFVFDRTNLGALLVDEPLTTGQWSDPAREIEKVKVRERYATAIFDEGNQVARIANVKVVPNEIVLPAQTTIGISGGIADIDPSTAVV